MKQLCNHIVALVLFFITLSTNAQQATPISLQKVLELGGANNLTIREFQQKQELAAANFAKAQEWWIPNLYAGVQTHQLWGAAMNSDGRFFLDVSRQTLWGGLGLNANWNFSEGIYKSKAIKLKLQASHYTTQAEKNKALLRIIHAYYNLQAAQLKLLAYNKLIWQADTITLQIEVQVDAGLRYHSELLLAKSNRNHLSIEMLNAKNEYNTFSAALVRLLNLDSKTMLVSVDTLMLPLSLQEEQLPVKDATYKNRPEIKSLTLTLQSLQTEKKITTTGLFIPRLNIGTYGSYAGRIYGVVQPMFPDQYPATNQLYPTGAFNASLIWNVPLGRLIQGGDLKKFNSLISIQEVKIEQLKSEINEKITATYQQLLVGKEQVQIAKKALQQTYEALTQSIDRQRLGTIKPFEVFQAQQFFLQAQIDYVQTVSAYNKAQFTLKVAKGEML